MGTGLTAQGPKATGNSAEDWSHKGTRTRDRDENVTPIRFPHDTVANRVTPEKILLCSLQHPHRTLPQSWLGLPESLCGNRRLRRPQPSRQASMQAQYLVPMPPLQTLRLPLHQKRTNQRNHRGTKESVRHQANLINQILRKRKKLRRSLQPNDGQFQRPSLLKYRPKPEEGPKEKCAIISPGSSV
jgi:hypothetical protein